MKKLLLILLICTGISTVYAQEDFPSAAEMEEARQMIQEMQRKAQQAASDPHLRQEMIHSSKNAGMSEVWANQEFDKAIGQMQSQSENFGAAIEMAQCMDYTNPETMKTMQKMQKDALLMHDQVKSLCAQGKVSEAEAIQRSFALNVASSKNFMKNAKCAEKFASQFEMPDMEDTTIAGTDTRTPKNICEAFSMYDE